MSSSTSDTRLPLVERIDSSLAPVDVFRRLSGLPHVAFFDSAMRHSELGRYSFVMADPIKWIELPADGRDALGVLEPEIAKLSGTNLPELPPFQGGWAGLFGYELAGSLERIHRAAIDEFGVPALAVGLYDVVVAFDHQEGAAWLISQGWPETDGKLRLERAADRLDIFRRRLASGAIESVHGAFRSTLDVSELAPQYAIPNRAGLTSNFSAELYQRTVQQAIDYIFAGDVFQVNLSQRLLHPTSGTAVDLYCRLRERNPAPFAGFLDGGAWQIASALPERFIKVANRDVETRRSKARAAGGGGRKPICLPATICRQVKRTGRKIS